MSPAHISLSNAGDLVASLGSPQFPARLWAWLRETVDPQSHYSVATRYRRDAPSQSVDSVDVLFFAGGDDPDGTRHALDLYTQGDWRTDTQLPHIERATDSQLVFSCNEDIDTATEYGRHFALGDLGEDCTLLGSERDYVYAFSLFRRRGQPSYTLAELALLRQLGDFVLPLLIQHARLARLTPRSDDGALLRRFEQRLSASGAALSQRERLVCRAVLQGRPVPQIADTLALKPSSVRTYLGRALVKLGLANRAGLFAWRDRRGTAALLDPYAGTDDCGLALWSQDALNEICLLADTAGFDLHFHTLADRAVRMTLDALEYVQIRNGRRDRRAQLAHLQLVDPADMSRFNRLGAIASVQTLWTAAREEQQLYRDLLGAERTARNYPFRSLRNAGAMLAAGSDWSVSTMDPMQIIQTGITHLLIDQPDSPPWNPHERLDLLTMREAYTVNTAYALRFDDCTGSLEAGKDASFAILDRNPFAHPVETFAQTRVIETCFRGEVVYAAPGWAD
ncbi:amidohydrolase family protein [Burkholderia contaminans]|uniref:amidohydrolase family protein n=1 Tax=Burkholderia contaminans TaxID=488447 RepID=UPI002D7F9222|nr:amidohydrolase family protein [Burkholderia contaminans]